MSNICCNCLFQRPLFVPTLNSKVRVFKQSRSSWAPNRSFESVESKPRLSKKLWKISCFKHEESSSAVPESELIEAILPEESVEPQLDAAQVDRSNVVKHDLISSFKKASFTVSRKPSSLAQKIEILEVLPSHFVWLEDIHDRSAVSVSRICIPLESAIKMRRNAKNATHLRPVAFMRVAVEMRCDSKSHVIASAAGEVFRISGKPWSVPWTAETIIQVMLLWIVAFWFVGSWIIPFLAHTAGINKDSLTYRGQALYSLLTDVAEGLAGIAILHRCLSRFRPLPSDWFKFTLKGNWHLDVGLGCLVFPLVNHLSQINLNLIPHLPSTHVTVSSVEQSIVARDPVAMALYAIVVSVCAPVWEEIVFRGFLLPSLTKYMPVWCSILLSAIVFALAHFNAQRMLPLILLGVVMGAVFTRSRNLLSAMLLHSLWNGFVFLDLMK
ncbi:hypothetical protein GIB67_027812 [Kingdonia uniflora]|uniref:CAAX prenyl protease 2/Lysostaphin resistance protein A-like domain-containing protein n=1 Tax=Kingdonia uniflora TaxID=39325 RepID=A0A7J7MHY8_9MAGN|nr:hypothetical protein GIB67_027812 [Kingdonia uniflora]